MLEINQIYCGDCVQIMSGLDRGSVDLVVTSPPYDNLRQYRGYSWDFQATAHELSRVIKPGGVIVWVVADAVIGRTESCSSFRQALYFVEECGLLLHDTMIYKKSGMSKPSTNRYHQVFEYMFVFSKDSAPVTFNPIIDRINKHLVSQDPDPLNREKSRRPIGMRFNVWEYPNGKNHTAHYNSPAFQHPAPFPERFAADHIVSWSNPDEMVLDPFCGSGTTLMMAKC